LEKKLPELNVDKVVVIGTVSNICVFHAVAGLALKVIKSFFPMDCISSISKSDEALAHRPIAFVYKGMLTTSGTLEIV